MFAAGGGPEPTVHAENMDYPSNTMALIASGCGFIFAAGGGPEREAPRAAGRAAARVRRPIGIPYGCLHDAAPYWNALLLESSMAILYGSAIAPTEVLPYGPPQVRGAGPDGPGAGAAAGPDDPGPPSGAAQ